MAAYQDLLPTVLIILCEVNLLVRMDGIHSSLELFLALYSALFQAASKVVSER